MSGNRKGKTKWFPWELFKGLQPRRTRPTPAGVAVEERSNGQSVGRKKENLTVGSCTHLLRPSVERIVLGFFPFSLYTFYKYFKAVAEIMMLLDISGKVVLRAERSLEVPPLIWTVLLSYGSVEPRQSRRARRDELRLNPYFLTPYQQPCPWRQINLPCTFLWKREQSLMSPFCNPQLLRTLQNKPAYIIKQENLSGGVQACSLACPRCNLALGRLLLSNKVACKDECEHSPRLRALSSVFHLISKRSPWGRFL